MRKLVLQDKTGFKNIAPGTPIIIRDARGHLFYETLSFNKPVMQFNMPAGVYYIDSGSFSPMSVPVNYELITLPPKERHRKSPKNFRVLKGDNPNKCSVLWDKNLIVYDRGLFDTSSKPIIVFMFGHEVGHRFYRTERYCDLYSANYMLKKGFNPSQIANAPIISLSAAQVPRKRLLVAKMIKHNGK